MLMPRGEGSISFKFMPGAENNCFRHITVMGEPRVEWAEARLETGETDLKGVEGLQRKIEYHRHIEVRKC